MKTQKDDPYLILLLYKNERRFKFIQANNPRRFDKPWQLNDRIWELIAKTKQDGSREV